MAAAGWGCVDVDDPQPSAPTVQRSEPSRPLVYFVRGEEDAPEIREMLQDRIGWILLPAPSGRVTEAGVRDGGTDSAPAPVSSAVCAECHAGHYEGFLQTAHARTSAPAEIENFQSPPSEQGVTIPTRIPDFEFQVRRNGATVEQTVRVDRPEGPFRHRERADVVVGSGKYGQTYLYWKGNELFQLPVSFLSYDNSWGLSPGYMDGTADFARPITTRCLDCHTAFAEHIPGSVNAFRPQSLLTGLNCGRCHGDVQEHVAWHRAHPDEFVARHITSPGELSPQQTNDLCAQCHSGSDDLLRPAFSFRPGDKLDEYLDRPNEQPSDHSDPHSANQLQRLEQSLCFQQSDGMTCITCHNPHEHERDQPLLFAERCLECHDTADSACDDHARLGEDAWRENCIQCHMPARHDPKTVTQTAESRVTPMLRDHRIAVWSEAAAAVRERALPAGGGQRAAGGAIPAENP